MDTGYDAEKIRRAHRWVGFALFWGSASAVPAVIAAALSGAAGMRLTFLVQILSPVSLAAGTLLAAWMCRDAGIGYPLRTDVRNILVGAVCAVLMWPGAMALSSLGGTDPASAAYTAAYVRDTGLFLTVLSTALLPALCEEFLVRGLLYGVFSKRCAVWGILVSSAGFALLHGDPAQALYAFYCGLVLGGIRYATGSLVPGMTSHFLFNASSVVIAYLSDPSAEAAAGPTMLPVAFFAMAVPCTVLMRHILRKTHARNGSPNESREGWPVLTSGSFAGIVGEAAVSLLLRW